MLAPAKSILYGSFHVTTLAGSLSKRLQLWFKLIQCPLKDANIVINIPSTVQWGVLLSLKQSQKQDKSQQVQARGRAQLQLHLNNPIFHYFPPMFPYCLPCMLSVQIFLLIT